MVVITILLVLFIIAAISINTDPEPARTVKTTTVSRSDRPYGSVKYLEDM